MRIAEFKRALFGIVNYGLLWLEMMDNPVLFTIKIGNGGYYEYCVGSSCET